MACRKELRQVKAANMHNKKMRLIVKFKHFTGKSYSEIWQAAYSYGKCQQDKYCKMKSKE